MEDVLDRTILVREFGIRIQSPVHSFIHSVYFYSTSSSPLLLRGALDYIIRVKKPKRYRQLRVKDLPKVAARLGFKPVTHPDARHRTYHCATMSNNCV